MPVYAYQCRACDNSFEVKQSFNDDPLTTCAVCETEGTVFRVIQPAGVVFKGSGWYVTDSRGKNSAGVTSTTKGGDATDTSAKSETTDTSAKGDSTAATPATKSSSPDIQRPFEKVRWEPNEPNGEA
ncbi:MAG: zinc ribbon domain-containing protein [Anaerolineales bacterium]|nr:zinc ribbon domain-containing protein [Anaerolineales bacterium]